MGAETSSTHLIFFITAMIIAASVATVAYTRVNTVVNAASAGGDTLSQQLKTHITIINDPAKIPKDGNGNYTFYVKNTGKSNLIPDQVTVLINGAVIPDSNVNKTNLVGNAVWRPVDVIQLNVTYSAMPSGSNTIKVVAENGIEDEMDFNI